jgi:hypothetical protein
MNNKVKILKNGFLLGFIIVGVIFLFLNSTFFISRQTWKYRNGFHISDWVDFSSTKIDIKGRKIIKKGKEVAKIKICFGKILIIRDYKTGEEGYYINK